MKVEKIIKPGRIDEAYAYLLSDEKCKVLGGGTWLEKNCEDSVNLLSLEGLEIPLDYIHSTTFTIQIGSETPLVKIAESDLLDVFNNGIFKHALRSYADERHLSKATAGGDLTVKPGNSHLIPALLVTDPMVLFYGYEKEALEDIHNEHLSYIPLEDYLKMEPLRDIMTEIVVPKTMNSHFVCKKDEKTGKTLLNVAVGRYGSQLRVAIGGRPAVAKLWRGNDKTEIDEIIAYFDFADDEAASAEERKVMAKELIQEAYQVIDFR